MTGDRAPRAASRSSVGRLTPRRLALGAGVVVAVAVPGFVEGFGLFLATTILALGLYGAAFDLLYGYTGLLSFGHSVFFGVGAYAAALSVGAGAGTIPGLLVAFVAAGLVAVALGLVAVRVTSHGFVIVTILLALVVHLVAVTWTDVTGGTDGLTVVVPPIPIPGVGEVSFLDPVVAYYVTLAVLLASLSLMGRLVASPVGLAFRMVRDNERRARLLGYDVRALKLGAFGASGAVAGVAGALSTYVTGFVSASDFSVIVAGDAIIFTLVGGRGTLVGAVLGAALVRLAADGISGLTTAYPLFVGALLVLTVVVEPEGLVGIGRRASGWLGARVTAIRVLGDESVDVPGGETAAGEADADAATAAGDSDADGTSADRGRAGGTGDAGGERGPEDAGGDG